MTCDEGLILWHCCQIFFSTSQLFILDLDLYGLRCIMGSTFSNYLLLGLSHCRAQECQQNASKKRAGISDGFESWSHELGQMRPKVTHVHVLYVRSVHLQLLVSVQVLTYIIIVCNIYTYTYTTIDE